MMGEDRISEMMYGEEIMSPPERWVMALRPRAMTAHNADCHCRTFGWLEHGTAVTFDKAVAKLLFAPATILSSDERRSVVGY